MYNMETPTHVTKNPFRIPMCEWCTSFQRRSCASPTSRFGVCINPDSYKFEQTVPVSLPGCSLFDSDTPGIRTKSSLKHFSDIQN